MAELYSIRLYYNTGFNAMNRPSAVSVLANATYRDFPSNYLWQNKDLATTRIKAAWNDVSEADYCRIGDQYYLVTGVSMQSGMTAEIGLQLDPILSIGGINAFTIVAGWTERAHVRSSDDTLFGNTLAEPWAPSQPLAIDELEQIGIPQHAENINIVESTVDLENISHVAEVYETEASSALQGTVTVPKIPVAAGRTTFGLNFRSNLKNFVFPSASFYNADAEGIADAINDVRSLGIDSAIVAAYQVPRNMFLVAPAGARVAAVTNQSAEYTPSENMLYRYGSSTVRNNKVYAMYNVYNLLSSCSGDRMEYKAEDIYSGGDAPAFIEYADLSPTGRPYIQPKRFHGADTKFFQEAVKGEEWFRMPLAYTGVSGSLVKAADYSRALERQEYEIVVNTAETGVRMLSQASKLDFGGAAETGIHGLVEQGRQFMSVQNDAVNYQTQQRVVAPVIAFPQNYGAQAYLGNTFFIYRTRLSDNDMVRADNFFTQFGYAQDKRFELSDLSNRQYFNFIKTRGADLKSSSPLRLRQQAASVLDAGVRLWHVLPNAAAMTYNP